MSKKSLKGQLNMFDYFKDIEEYSDDGEVQMVSMVPEDLIEEEVIEEEVIEEDIVSQQPVTGTKFADSDVTMKKEKFDASGKLIASVVYINYNKVKVYNRNEGENTFEFDNSKDAVDFYIKEMLKIL